MKKKSKEKRIFFITGIYFLLLQLVIFVENYFAYRYNIFFWFCNHTPLLFGLFFLAGKKDWIKAIINIGFLVQFIWVFDFISNIFFGSYSLGVTQYIFESELGWFILIPLFAHALSTNVALAHTYKIKPNKKVLIYSGIYILLLYFVTLTYAPIENNINCVYNLCGIQEYTFAGYTLLWPLLVFVIIILPTHGIQHIFYKLYKRKSLRKD